MSIFFKSKYQTRLEFEDIREERIRNIQQNFKTSREYAVRYVDYQDHELSRYAWSLAGALFLTVGRASLKRFSTALPLINKEFIYYPLLGASFWLGSTLYDKLRGHYFNWQDHDIAHIWLVDLAEKYKVKKDEVLENWQNNLALTPIERLKASLEEQLNKLKIDKEYVLGRYSKDRDDIFFMLGKVRNLENIAYLKEEDLQNINSALDLQLKLDSVSPSVNENQTNDDIYKNFLKNVEIVKKQVEESRKFRSDKDKLLGLPFLLHRLRQFPEPAPHTWQWNLYKEIFGDDYAIGLGEPETEEKINKYNYAKFLHPSIIKKYDTDSEEFEMLIRKMNLEQKTQKQIRTENREFFCKNIMPFCNLTQDQKISTDFAHYMINNSLSNTDAHYYYDQYSGQKEEKLFRMAEEFKFMDKNKYFLYKFQYSQIDKSRIGIKAEELHSILTNPVKAKKIRKALEESFPNYEPQKYMDRIKKAAERTSFLQTIIENDVDLDDPEQSDILNLWKLQYENPPATEEQEAINSYHVNFAPPGLPDMNSYPTGEMPVNIFHYDNALDYNDYQSDFYNPGLISPKINRFELFNDNLNHFYDSFNMRRYNHPKYANLNSYIDNVKDANNEDLADRILRTSNFKKYTQNYVTSDEDKDLIEFLENQTEKDTFGVSDDVTEEDLDQAVFEAQYAKPTRESDEYKKIQSRNPFETQQLFKLVDFEPHELWNDSQAPKQITTPKEYVDKPQTKDPLYHLYSEVEQPVILRQLVKRWRKGAEVRYKLPYYPETKTPAKTFNYH